MKTILLLLVSLLLVACGPLLVDGNVIDKKFEPAHEEHYTTSVYIGDTCYGTYPNEICTANYVHIPQTRFVPDKWTVKFQKCDNGENCRDRTFEVAKETYDTTSIGQYFYTGEEIE